MNHDEIICQYIEKDKKILYVGTPCDDIIKQQATPSDIQFLNAEALLSTDISSIPKDLDYVLFTDALELVDNPKELISTLKWHGTHVVIYEFKHYEGDTINPEWKLPWLHVGLENFLTWEFDYVQSIYLGYATVFFCNGPNADQPETVNKELTLES